MYQLPVRLGTVLKKELEEVTLLDLLVLTQPELAYFLEDILPRSCTTVVEKTIVVDPPMKDGVDRRPLLCAHLDTISRIPPLKKDMYKKGDTLHLTKRSRAQCLGGDDRAGVYIMLQLILSDQFDKYTYCFFWDEETGCQGSSEFSYTDEFDELETRTSCFIGVDRYCKPGVPEIAQYGCDSAELDEDLMELLPEFKLTLGSMTDCMTLSEDSRNAIPCFNITAGYQHEHSIKETIHIPSMENTIDALKKLDLPDKQYEYVDSFVVQGMLTGDYEDDYVEIVCEECGRHHPLFQHPEYNMHICEWCLELYIDSTFNENLTVS